jgi:hypothetical protein
MLRVDGREERVAVADISRGGALVACGALVVRQGAEVAIAMPVGSPFVAARVVRVDGRTVAVAFAEDASARVEVERMLASVKTPSRKAAA